MNLNQRLEEIRYIYDTYTTIEHLKPLFTSLAIVDNRLKVQWINQEVSLIDVNLNGWFLTSDKDKCFPTFEGLCMWKDRDFSISWGNQLNKLLAEEEKEDE